MKDNEQTLLSNAVATMFEISSGLRDTSASVLVILKHLLSKVRVVVRFKNAVRIINLLAAVAGFHH